MKPAPHRPLLLNDLDIYIPAERKGGISRSTQILFALSTLAGIVFGLVALERIFGS